MILKKQKSIATYKTPKISETLPETEPQKKVRKYSDKELLHFLWSYVKPHRKAFYSVLLFLLFNIVISIASPLLFRSVMEQIESSDAILAPVSWILLPLLAYFLLMLIRWFTDVGQRLFTVQLNSPVTNDMRIRTFEGLLQNKVSFFDHAETGILTSNITNDIQEMYDTGERLVVLFTSLTRLIITLIILLVIFAPLAGVCIAFIPFFFIITFLLRKYQRGVEKRWRKNFGNVNQRFNETLRSIAISKTFHREEENIRQFCTLNELTYRSSIRRGFAIFLVGPTNDFLRRILLLLILIVGTIQSSMGNLDVASFYLFIFIMDYYFVPVMILARNYGRFQALFANLERLLEISGNVDEKEVLNGKYPLTDINTGIEFSHVDFSYAPEKQILFDISFRVQQGQRVALVGHTGAGKSTIAALLLRFYDIQRGSIQIDGQDLREYNLQDLRRSIGLVSQRILLFNGTIRENLLLGNPEATDTEIWAALDAVQARDFIEQLPEGLNTIVMENGKNLSVGQRQMLSFARTLLSNPKLIVLDEATSSVDLYTESRIQDAIDLMLQGRMSIVIAHRLTTILKSDWIVVLENGRVVQQGTHHDLMQQIGPYNEMYRLYFETQSAQYLDRIKTVKSFSSSD